MFGVSSSQARKTDLDHGQSVISKSSECGSGDSSRLLADIAESLRVLSGRVATPVDQRLDRIEKLLAELRPDTPIVKMKFTVGEAIDHIRAAGAKPPAAWTLRDRCRQGLVEGAERTEAGHYLLPLSVVERIANEGLPPKTKKPANIGELGRGHHGPKLIPPKRLAQ